MSGAKNECMRSRAPVINDLVVVVHIKLGSRDMYLESCGSLNLSQVSVQEPRKSFKF